MCSSDLEQGVLSDGSPLIAQRTDAPSLTGANAACINCHRKSGLGSIEARNVIPPVTGRYLYHPPEDSEDAARLPYLPNSRLERPSYTYDTLATAIREGLELNLALDDDAVRTKLMGMGSEILKSSPEEFGAFIRKENERWSKLVRETGAKVD